MRSHLKVKVFSLSAEMTYIRRQEEKWKARARYARQKFGNADYAMQNFWSQHHHRNELKLSARITHLAYGFMRGIPYSSMENICYGPIKGMGGSEPDWAAIESTVIRFSKLEDRPQDIIQRFAEWLSDAHKWYDGNEERIMQLNYERPARIAALKAMKVPYKATI